jgi:flagellar motor switch protein FliM
MLDGFVRSMKEAWQDVVAVEPSLESVESNPQLNQMMSPTESVALVTFVLEVADVQSFANLCIPYLSIEKVSDKLTGQSWFQKSGSEGNMEYAAALQDRIRSSRVNLSIFLGSTDITVRDFLNKSPNA